MQDKLNYGEMDWEPNWSEVYPNAVIIVDGFDSDAEPPEEMDWKPNWSEVLFKCLQDYAFFEYYDKEQGTILVFLQDTKENRELYGNPVELD